MEKALYACDEVTGLITAVALVRPSRSLSDLEASSVKKKWKDRAFAAGANRDEIAKATQEFGLELWEHVGNVILAMRTIAPELGLAGEVRSQSFSDWYQVIRQSYQKSIGIRQLANHINVRSRWYQVDQADAGLIRLTG